VAPRTFVPTFHHQKAVQAYITAGFQSLFRLRGRNTITLNRLGLLALGVLAQQQILVDLKI